jgi:hypothetical protein
VFTRISAHVAGFPARRSSGRRRPPIHYVTSVFAAFEFKVEPVVDVMDAVAAQVQAIEYRKKNVS